MTTTAPSSPPRVPRVAGSFLLGSAREFRRAPLALLERIGREHGEIARVRLGLFDTLMTSAPALVEQVLVDHADAFGKSFVLRVFARPLLGEGLLTSEHAQHGKQRRLLAPTFTPRRVGSHATLMTSLAERSLERMLAHETVDLTAESMQVTLEVVTRTLFDVDLAAQAHAIGEAFTEAMSCVIATVTSALPLPPSVPTRANRRLRQATRRLDAIVYAIIAERRRDPRDRSDLLSLLLSARDAEGSAMSDRQVRDEALTLFLAGHETTANAIAWALYLLARHPAARADVERELSAVLGPRLPTRDDLSKLPSVLAVLKEAMRLYPPIFLLTRRARRDLTLGGCPVQKGQIVALNVYGMHRRPDLYEAPSRFDPARFGAAREAALPRYAYLPFGAGPRLCIGNHFALMEGQLVLATWLRRARFSLLDPAGEAEAEPLLTLRPRAPLRMRVTPRDMADATGPEALPRDDMPRDGANGHDLGLPPTRVG